MGVFGLGSKYVRLLASSTVSNLGDGIHVVALPLLASTLTTDPRLIAGLAAATSVPAVILALPVGGLVDRLNKGRVLIGADLFRLLLLAALAVGALAGTLAIWHLFVISFLLGAAELFFDTSSFSYLPSVVSKKDLPRANGYLATTSELGNGVAGPGLGGLLFSASSALPFAINGLSFLASALLLRPFGRVDKKPATPGIAARKSLWCDISEGLRHFLTNRTLRTLLTLSAGSSFFGWMPESVFVLYAKNELGLSDFEYGVIYSATSVGAVLGGILAFRFTAHLHLNKVLVVTFASYGALLLPPAFLSSALIVGLILLVQGVPLIVWRAAHSSIQQSLVSEDFLGRTRSTFRLVLAIATPLGMVVGGFLAGLLGVRMVFVIAGLGMLGTLLACRVGIKQISDELRAQDADPEAPAVVDG
ncbi:MFS transporter [Streptomyces sp. NPDC001739]